MRQSKQTERGNRRKPKKRGKIERVVQKRRGKKKEKRREGMVGKNLQEKYSCIKKRRITRSRGVRG